MKFIADLHVHSRFSVATSKDMDLPHIHHWAQLKGIQVLATGDCTHPKWFQEIQEQLVPTGNGLFALSPDYDFSKRNGVPQSCRSEVRFVLSAEISTIYKKNGKVRKVHHLLLLPDVDTASRLNAKLDRIGNIRSDGRPILGLDSRDLVELALEVSPEILFIPAHAWTPHFSVLGAKSGFNSVEDCYGDLTGHIFAIETGLSSDPPMNWRISGLDGFALVSNSDAHSPSKLGRNANLFDCEVSFAGIARALHTRRGLSGTLDMYPQEGKYHYDGHRPCGRSMSPEETIQSRYLCPDCNAKVTVGVMHRVAELADRPAGYRPSGSPVCKHIVPVIEVLSEVMEKGVNTQPVQRLYMDLLNRLGPELHILLETSLPLLREHGSELIAEAILRVRDGRLHISPGYDGVFGKIRIFDAEDRAKYSKQLSLF
ncbi:MAG: DNA helicase UvrD [Deltaproteobacteria bacterium]|nr:DNA helicase UvrD [Deltaproteobacteria bacterium]